MLEQLALDVDSLRIARPTTPEGVNAVLLRHCERLFPYQPGSGSTDPNRPTQVVHTVRQMWAAYQAYKTARAGNPALTRLQNTSATLRAHARFKEIQKDLRKQGLANRKARVLAELEAAETAAQAGDMHKLYYHIRKLSPQGPRENIHIRSPEGKLISPEAEHDAIIQYYTGVFSRDAANPQQACVLQHEHSLSQEELAIALSKQRSGRAFPPGSAPPELWKYLAPTLFHHVLPLINSCLSPGLLRIPGIWTDCWLKPLPKPGKPPTSAPNLRPIALQDPFGKCIARVVKSRIQAEILEKLAATPQFAYLPARSTASAISRAARFCASVRDKLQSSRIEVRDRKAGKTRSPITGGGLLSIDMSKAFDYVSHSYLASSLRHLVGPCAAPHPVPCHAQRAHWGDSST